ncbi:hypothetical protein [Anaplasma centrale]|uniref:hypothetical protein n=1 Tax=Anaplasma centrale TaxID=769 RepID=UPI0011D17635|nr:hypothetical protein [Anaplasma centrale]
MLKKNLAGRLLIARYAVKKALNSIPCNVAGVYKMLGANGLVLYVGKAKDLKKRRGCLGAAISIRHRYAIQTQVGFCATIHQHTRD